MSFMQWIEAIVTNPLWGGIASLLTIVGIVFAAVYWWVLRRQELHQLRWTQYQQTISSACGWGYHQIGQPTPPVLQVTAVYQLVEFKEFAYMTVVSLEYAQAIDSFTYKKGMEPHVERAIALLQNTKAYKNQAKQFASHES
jgi:hypothetical protein